MDFTLESTVCTGKILAAAGKRAGLLSSFQHSLDHARASFQCTQERCYKSDTDLRLCKSRESIETGNYLIIVVRDGVTKTPKLEVAVGGPY